jgi:hypothetical protein
VPDAAAARGDRSPVDALSGVCPGEPRVTVRIVAGRDRVLLTGGESRLGERTA